MARAFVRAFLLQLGERERIRLCCVCVIYLIP